MNDINKLKVNINSDIRTAIKVLDEAGEGVCLCVDDSDNVIGIITNGDFRRSILDGISLEKNVLEIVNKDFVYLNIGYTTEDVERIFNKYPIQHIPILDNKKLINLITHDSLICKDLIVKEKKYLDIPVVIMAGGKGTRLAPFTNIFPKPLIPIGDKTIIELIIDEFLKFGISEYYFTINYKGNMIKAYFDNIEKNYNVNYILEKEFCGTAGSLSLLSKEIKSTFIVSNCDILVKADMADVYKFHKENNSTLTLISSIQHHTIPYGVVEFGNGGKASAIKEKPEYTFPINTGVYMLEPECLDYIPPNEVFHMTHLSERLMAEGKNVTIYPVNESEYIDIGQWEEYREAVNKIII